MWVNEVVWALEIVRKVQFNATEGQDPMEAAAIYVKSTMILDLVATLPQVASMMNSKYAFLKIIRIY